MAKNSNLEGLPKDWIERFFEVLDPAWLAHEFKRLERFRERFSPLSRWWHRPPKMSPVVPLFYWPMLGLRMTDDQPMGVWRGDPSRILGRLLGAIMEFIDFWDSLPDGRGRKQLRNMLRNAGRFFGFLHEVRLASHIKLSGYHVEPLFFDPASKRGEPDLIVHDGLRRFDVQCKAMNPSASSEFPYDLFQYFAGAYARLIQDSRRSYSLYLNLKQRVDADGVRRLLSDVSKLIRSGVILGGVYQKPAWDIYLVEYGLGQGTESARTAWQLSGVSQGEPLYFEVAEVGPDIGHPGLTQIATCYVFGQKRRGLEEFVFKTANEAAQAHRGDRPLIISLAVYQDTDMGAYLNGPRVGEIYREWLDRFFEAHRGTAMLMISSNYTRYLRVGGAVHRDGSRPRFVAGPAPGHLHRSERPRRVSADRRRPRRDSSSRHHPPRLETG